MSIGDKIKERRIALGITQEELAKKMGYKSRSSINKIELGINDIPQSKIVKFAQILRVSPGYLMSFLFAKQLPLFAAMKKSVCFLSPAIFFPSFSSFVCMCYNETKEVSL